MNSSNPPYNNSNNNFYGFLLYWFYSLLLLFTFPLLPFISSLSTVAISEASNQTLVCALTLPYSSLNCSTFPGGFQVPAVTNIPASFSGVVAGEGFVCGLSSFSLPSNSTIFCWRFSDVVSNITNKRIYQGQSLAEMESGNSHICGLVDGAYRLECWQWPGFDASNISRTFSSVAVGEDFVCGLSAFGKVSCEGGSGITNASIRQVPNGSFRAIAAGFRHVCALNSSDYLDCWGEIWGEMPKVKFKSVALGENRTCALRSNDDTVVCWGQNNFSVPKHLRETQFISIEGKRNVFCGVSSNYSLYCWGNENLDSRLMVLDKVLPGPCRSMSVCRCRRPLQESSNYCQTGYGICQHCENDTSTEPLLPPSAPPPRWGSISNRWSNKMIAFLVVGCVGTSCLLLVICFFLFRYCNCRGYRVHDSGRLDTEAGSQPPQRCSMQRQDLHILERAPPVRALEEKLSQLTSMGNAGQLEEFSLAELVESTDNFSENRKVGTGSFGSVYHGTLKDRREVAIKRAEVSSNGSCAKGSYKRQEDKDNAFINELESLSRLHHKHLVRLLGFCEDSNERILVYEYMENGTLHDHLHKLQSSPLMSWSTRIQIALEAAKGIEYLHEYVVPPIIHRDIKSSNILLDAMWTAKVSDFGLSLMGPQDENSHLSLRAAGTVGYMDPEYYRLQQLTTKSDIYSFGVVLLEILSGYKAIHKNENGVPRNVVDFVLPYIDKDEIHRVLDRRVPPPTPIEIEAVAYVGYMAADCVMLEGRDRPTMTEIVNILERALAACRVHPTTISLSTTGSST